MLSTQFPFKFFISFSQTVVAQILKLVSDSISKDWLTGNKVSLYCALMELAISLVTHNTPYEQHVKVDITG